MAAYARLQVLAGGAEPVPVRRFELGLLAGRFVELSGVGAPLLSSALRLVHEAQRSGENVVWVAAAASTFYAPDAALAGIDLAALPIVLTAAHAEPLLAAGRAVSHLLRSGAFGLVVLDLGGCRAAGRSASGCRAAVDLPTPLQSRLAGLAQKHGTALVALTSKPAGEPSLGSLVSLHATAARGPAQPGADGHLRVPIIVTAIKDKRHGPGWSHVELFRTPDDVGLGFA